MSKQAGRPGRTRRPVLYVLERYPELSQTFVEGEIRELVAAGVPVEVLALAPGRTAPGQDPPAARPHYAGAAAPVARVRAAASVAAREPGAVAAFLGRERAWPPPDGRGGLRGLARIAPWVAAARQARHLHAHFATEAADIARVLSRLSGTPFSFVAHAFDGFQDPRDLRRNLSAAAFCVTVCEYNRRHIDAVAPGLAGKVSLLVVGADLVRFRRRRPYAPGGPVVAVGRLVPQKGFDDLVVAAGLARDALAGREVVIVGEGPERPRLERLIAQHDAPVRLVGSLGPADVRDALEGASLSTLPCVIAPDGDRDSMPVVLKEAMALELPVLGTDEVGLPELIGPDRGRLVPPHDPDRLAAGLLEILRLTPEERVTMGRAGRAFVAAHCDERVQARALLRRIDGVAAAPGGTGPR